MSNDEYYETNSHCLWPWDAAAVVAFTTVTIKMKRGERKVQRSEGSNWSLS